MTVALSLPSAGQARPALTAPRPQDYVVRLIDRRSGLTHRVNGSPLILLSDRPDLAVAQLLAGRDATVWEARVEPVGTTTRSTQGRA
jgi:hypothetical protein